MSSVIELRKQIESEQDTLRNRINATTAAIDEQDRALRRQIQKQEAIKTDTQKVNITTLVSDTVDLMKFYGAPDQAIADVIEKMSKSTSVLTALVNLNKTFTNNNVPTSDREIFLQKLIEKYGDSELYSFIPKILSKSVKKRQLTTTPKPGHPKIPSKELNNLVFAAIDLGYIKVSDYETKTPQELYDLLVNLPAEDRVIINEISEENPVFKAPTPITKKKGKKKEKSKPTIKTELSSELSKSSSIPTTTSPFKPHIEQSSSTTGFGVGIMIPEDVNKGVQRLTTLVGEILSGNSNNNLKNEISMIIDNLMSKDVISKKEHKMLNKKYIF